VRTLLVGYKCRLYFDDVNKQYKPRCMISVNIIKKKRVIIRVLGTTTDFTHVHILYTRTCAHAYDMNNDSCTRRFSVCFFFFFCNVRCEYEMHTYALLSRSMYDDSSGDSIRSFLPFVISGRHVLLLCPADCSAATTPRSRLT